MKNKIVAIIMGVLFLVSSITVLFSAGSLLGEIFKTYILKAEYCEFAAPISFPERENITERTIPEEKCKINYNRAKERISDSLALLIIGIPIAFFTYRKVWSLREN